MRRKSIIKRIDISVKDWTAPNIASAVLEVDAYVRDSVIPAELNTVIIGIMPPCSWETSHWDHPRLTKGYIVAFYADPKSGSANSFIEDDDIILKFGVDPKHPDKAIYIRRE